MTSTLIYLTATSTDKLDKLVKRGQLEKVSLSRRFHDNPSLSLKSSSVAVKNSSTVTSKNSVKQVSRSSFLRPSLPLGNYSLSICAVFSQMRE
jgi:late competence protein required for DNA uptake (superfamily II DNA/RNA helicase)